MLRNRYLALVWIVLIGLFGLGTRAATLPEQCRQIIQSKGKTNEAVRLHQLFDAHWSYTMEQFPETATANGYPGRHRTWTDYSLQAIQGRKRDLLPMLDAAKSI